MIPETNTIIAVAAAIPEKKAHLHFYMLDIVSGPNPTAIKVVTNLVNGSLFTFGVITAVDDPLTEGPSPTSKLMGRAQGLYSHASLQGASLLFTLNFVFVEGKYNGSTLAVVGRDDVSEAVRELPVVGGTGRFRLARGYALLKTHVVDLSSGDAILELDVYIMHH